MMKRKFKRMLSILLVFCMVCSSWGFSTISFAAESNVDEAAADEMTEDTTEDAVDAEAGVEDSVLSEYEVDELRDLEDVEESAAKSAVPSAVEEEDVMPMMLSLEDEEVAAESAAISMARSTAPTDETKISALITDSALRQAVLKQYNAEMGSSVTDANFNYGQLKKYTGTLDFTGISGVKSISGLGSAKAATSIDISALTGISEIPEEEFYECQFESFKMPLTVTKIGDGAFYGCSKLQEIILPDTMTVMGNRAFANCTNLSKISSQRSSTVKADTLPVGLTSVGTNVFDSALVQKVILPAFSNGAVLELATGLFYNCKSLEEISIDNNITVIPESAFSFAGVNASKGVKVAFGTGLVKISASAFSDVKLAEDVIDLSDTALTDIGSSAFAKAVNLKTVILPKKNSVKVLGEYAFACTELSTMYVSGTVKNNMIYVPDTIESIGKGCFYGNKEMTSVSLSPKLTAIPDYMFDGCSALATVEQRQAGSSSEVKKIGDCAFRGTAIENTDFMLKMNKLEQIGIQDVPDKAFTIKKGVWEGLVGKDAKTSEQDVLSLAAGGEDSSIQEDETTHQKTNSKTKKYYGSEVFSDCANLTSVSIPASVKVIGTRAFYYRSYEKDGNVTSVPSVIEEINWASVTGTSTVERRLCTGAFQGAISKTAEGKIVLPYASGETLVIEKFAFATNGMLESIQCGSQPENVLSPSVTKIGTGAFFDCMSLPAITVCDMANGGAPELGEMIFEGCVSMSKAVLPQSITEIPRHCFYGAPLTSFGIGVNGDGSPAAITKIGTLAFFGNMSQTWDLSKYTGLQEIGSGAFAFCDMIKEDNEEGKDAKIGSAYGAHGGSAQLQKMILPDTLGNTLFINTGTFSDQVNFDTMGTKSKTTAGTIYIPDYMVAGSARALFSNTGVKKVQWQADSTGKNPWTEIPPIMYLECSQIVNAEDVLPQKDYVTSLSVGTFMESSVKEADLSHFIHLETIGSGTAESPYNEAGVFQDCYSLTKVVLPQSDAANFVASKKTFAISSANLASSAKLSDVDLGTLTELGVNAFWNNGGLKKINFPDTLAKIGQNSFNGCTELTTVGFGKLKEIGNNAFQGCTKLVLTEENNLSQELEKIGANAFMSDENLGDAVFGSKLKEIGSAAFQKSGLRTADFSSAVELATIGSGAFQNTLLETFSLKNTKVATIESSVLTGCANLTRAAFGDSVVYIKENAINGCPKFKDLEIAATTTVNRGVFKGAANVNNINTYTAKDNKYAITVAVTTPKTTVIPLGKQTTLPYYIYEKGLSNINTALIGQGAADSSVQEYLKLSARLTDGYFWGTATNDEGGKYKITDEQYFENLVTSPVEKYNNKDVDVIKITALKIGQFNFAVTSSMSFDCADKDNPIISSSNCIAVYNISIEEMKYHPELYKTYQPNNKDNLYSNPLKDSVQADGSIGIQGASNNSKGGFQCYYDLAAEAGFENAIDNYDVVVTSDNPDVLCPGNSANAVYLEGGYIPANTTNTNNTPNRNNMRFYLAAKKVGTATITVYPKGYENNPDYGTAFRFVVNADINNLKLAVPKDYSNWNEVGSSFSVFSSCTNVYNETVEDIAQLATITNRGIVFESAEPEFVSVDERGNVTILKADAKNKTVNVTATTETSAGVNAQKVTVQIKIKGSGTSGTTGGNENPNTPNTTPPKVNAVVEDSASKTTVVVTKPAQKDLEGEVKVDKINDTSATTVTVPDTVTVNGVKYKVTSVTAGAFANNKKVQTVVLGQYVTKIESGAFSGCTSLTSVTIPASVTEIGAKAFYNCKKLKTITFKGSSTLTKIGDSAFQGCKALTKITIPAKVTEIGAKAFYNCSKLKTITVKSTVLNKVGKNAFKGIHKKAVIKVPKKKYSAYKKLLKNKGQKKTVKIKK
ncbi:MAG: leucine-rich repeat domain-containing protein [Clostridium sp.]|nr:leucine-rich repeat domain-containing protein [Clostridium sp.]